MDSQIFSRHRSIYCIGRNHPDLPIVKQDPLRSSNLGQSDPPWPSLSSKSISSLGSMTSVIPITSSNQQVDWEAELVIEIGHDCFQLFDFSTARQQISRWGVGNDLTDRYWQNRGGGQWIRGKSFPGFAPFVFGPNAHQAAMAHDLSLEVYCYVNNELMQHGLLSELIHPPDHLVWQISQSIQLLKGDLIFCGTFPGSALNRIPSNYLRPGDYVRTEINGLGCLENLAVENYSEDCKSLS